MAPRGQTKKRFLSTAAELFRRQGYHGTGLSQILDESGAPSGSLYFHFPGGKTELAVEAVTAAGREIGQGIELLLESNDDVAKAVGCVVDYLARDLHDSDYQHGCPVGTVALDTASASEPIRLACRTIFDEWAAKIESRLKADGWARKEAAEEALVVVAAIEGALLLARSRRDTKPLEAVAHHLRATLARPASRRRRRKRPEGLAT